MRRSTSSTRIMLSTSRISSSNSSGLTPQSSDRVLNSYSDRLIDDLFGDVERLLEGDPSEAESSGQLIPQPVSPADWIVQLPACFSPRSAADFYKVAMSADRSEASSTLSSLASDSSATLSSCRTSYQNGERSVTAHQLEQLPVEQLPIEQSPIESSPERLQSRVIHQSSVYSSAVCALRTDATRNSTKSIPPIQSVLSSLYPPTPNLDGSFTKDEMKPSQTTPTSKHRQSSLLFLTVGAIGVVAANVLGLWAASAAFDRKLPTDSNAVATSSALLDADFLAYQEDALETIEASRRAVTQTVAGLPVPALELPTSVPVVNPVVTGELPKLPDVAAEAPNVVERVFVPTYQNGQPQHSPSVNSNPARATAALPPIALATANNNQPRPTVPTPEPTAPVSLPSEMPAAGMSSIPILPAGGNPLPAPGIDLTAGSTVNSTTALTDVTPTSELVLVGVLNLGDRSAALFDIDGSSQRVYVGDPIGLSNWTLASVDGKDVVIRRNDEVRSVYIGQRF